MIYFQIIYLTSAHLVHLTTKVTSVLRLHNKFRYRTHLIDSFNRDPIQCKCKAPMCMLIHINSIVFLLNRNILDNLDYCNKHLN